MTITKRFLASLLAASISLAGLSARAGEGHDHGAQPTGAGVPASPRVVADSESYQFTGILEGEVLVIYLDRARDNEPVTAAELEVTVDGENLKVERQDNGTYEVVSPALRASGEKEVLVTVREGDASDLLIGTLSVPPAAVAHAASPWRLDFHQLTALPIKPDLAMLGLPLFGAFLLGAAFRTRPAIIGALILAGLATLFATTTVRAGPGHDHGPEPAAAANGNAPARQPDGSIFLPKPTQRLLDVRTTVVEPQSAVRAVRFPGRVVPNPNRSGFVQSTIAGRIVAANGGLPRLGQTVKAGDVLGFVQPAFASIDASNMRQTEGDLDQRISLVTARLDRLRRLASADIASRASLEEAEIELQGLRKRREELQQAQNRPEPLVAPVDGVVAETTLVLGQVVAPSDILMRIVDPSGFWVEALVYDQTTAGAVTSASAMAVDGARLKLSFVGRSRALQQQATLVHFEILDPPAHLDAGAPVTVMATTGDPVSGIILPRTALAQSPNGQTVVFQHKEAELFVPKAVRIENLDADRVLIVGGLATGDKVVVRNAPLVNQVR
ncbi:efflux RND transporter periplasmic adaptor subunit [Alsobacter sp. R-9]